MNIIRILLLILACGTLSAQNRALLFDGTDDNVYCGNPTEYQITEGTIEAKVKAVSPGAGYRAIVAKQDVFGLYLYYGELIAFDYNGVGNIGTGIYLTDDQWHHVAMTFSGNNVNGIKIYINGDLKTIDSRYGPYFYDKIMYIGEDNPFDGYNQFVGATIDEVRLWNVVRTQAEIQETMNQELSTGSGLVAAFHFNEGTGTSAANAVAGGTGGTLSNFNFNASSGWVMSAALPIELTHFSGRSTEKGTLLTWNTASEINAGQFDVERSYDGKAFEGVGTTMAREAYAQYNFTDIHPPTNGGVLYYRLKMTDEDGRFVYSNIISVTAESDHSAIQIYPTYTSGMVWITDVNQGIESITVYDLLGQPVLFNSNALQIDLSVLPSGIYLIQVSAGNEKVVEKVVLTRR